MHGLGNDFIVVDLRSQSSIVDRVAWLDAPKLTAALCDRRRGIGADGILAILPPTAAGQRQGAVARMRIINADGSEPEMCGNGLRCVARYLQSSEKPEAHLDIETAAGVLGCTFFAAAETGESDIELAMGRPSFHTEQLGRSLPMGDGALTFYCVSLGNPHAVIFCDDATGADELHRRAERYGRRIETDPLFPERTNVEFARSLAGGELEVVVWERGCGITQACGTGACATAVAACLTGRAVAGHLLKVVLPGGSLTVRLEPDFSQVFLRGPATTVYSGLLELPDGSAT